MGRTPSIMSGVRGFDVSTGSEFVAKAVPVAVAGLGECQSSRRVLRPVAAKGAPLRHAQTADQARHHVHALLQSFSTVRPGFSTDPEKLRNP
jgi:hypothetical protein